MEQTDLGRDGAAALETITPEPIFYGGLNPQGWIPVRAEVEYCLGWDIGQTTDPSALALVRRQRTPIPFEDGGVGSDLVQRLGDDVFITLALERLPLGLNYVDQAAIVKSRLAIAQQRAGAPVALCLDQTGVGRAVANIATLAGLDFTAITICAGLVDDRNGSEWRIGKSVLCSILSAAFHSKSLKILATLKEAAVLADEIRNFRATINESNGNVAYGARTGKHDDLTLALCCALAYLTPQIGSAWTSQPIEL
jgi:hypothetical protein